MKSLGKSDTSRTRCWGAEKGEAVGASAEGEQEGDGKIRKRGLGVLRSADSMQGSRTWFSNSRRILALQREGMASGEQVSGTIHVGGCSTPASNQCMLPRAAAVHLGTPIFTLQTILLSFTSPYLKALEIVTSF